MTNWVYLSRPVDLLPPTKLIKHPDTLNVSEDKKSKVNEGDNFTSCLLHHLLHKGCVGIVEDVASEYCQGICILSSSYFIKDSSKGSQALAEVINVP